MKDATQPFVHTKEKAQGRWPKYCPECLPKYSKVPKKKDVQAIAEKSSANYRETGS
ncbi:MAG: hypothetical protein ACLRU1_03385 [Veillonella parvula]